MTLMRKPGKQAAGKNHLVAGVRIDQTTGRSLQAHHAREEGDQHDAQHCSGSHWAKRIGQNGGHRISKSAIDNRANIDHGHNQGKADEGCCNTANVNRATHRFGDTQTGLRDFLGDIATGLESVVLEDTDKASGQECCGV